MSGGKPFPWGSLMAHFLGERGMRPADFWALTLPEIRAVLGGDGDGGGRLQRSTLDALMEAFPDG